MSDQQVPDEVQEANDATPEQDAIVDWKKRYEDLRPQYDRTQNELQRFTDPEKQQEILQEWGYSVDSGEYEDPAEQWVSKAEFEQALAERDQSLMNERAALHAQGFAEDRLREHGVQEGSKAWQWIENYAINSLPAIQDELGAVVPDIDAAYEEYAAMMNEEKASWGNTKRKAPAPATEGQENTGVPAWRNIQDPDERREARNAWAAEQMALRNRDQSGV